MATAADFYTLTPGSAVAGALQDILARRKMEARQSMLDRMASEEQRSVHSARDEQQRMAREQLALSQQEEARQKSLSDAQLRESQEKLMQGRLGNVSAGTRAEDIKDAELNQYMQQGGLFRAEPVSPAQPTVTGDTVEGASMQSLYSGTPKEQTEATSRGRVEDIVRNMQGETDPEKLRTSALGLIPEGINPPGTLIERRMPFTTVDPDTGNKRTYDDVTVPESRGVDVLPRRPVPYTGVQANGYVNYEVTTKDGQTVVKSMNQAQRKALDDDSNVVRIIETGIKSLAPPPVRGPSGTEVNMLTKMREQWQAAHSFRSPWMSDPMDPEQLASFDAAYDQALGSVYAKDPATVSVKELAKQIARDPELSNLPTTEALKSFQVDNATPKDIEDLDRLLNYTRGAGFIIAPEQ